MPSLRHNLAIPFLSAFAIVTACTAETTSDSHSDTAAATSLLGEPLRVAPLDSATRVRLEANLAAVSDSLRLEPQSADRLIWVGRRLAYLGRYREAIDTFTAGIERFPSDARFLRHRGHRYLTIRKPVEAAADFTRASELIAGTADAIEPDGAPNARNIPLSTDHFNIWYHLGLSHYVNGDFEKALAAYDSCMKVSVNPDLEVATSYWRYLTLRHLRRHDEAEGMLAIARANPELIENVSYLRLLRLFAGLESVENVQPTDSSATTVGDATTAYGVSMWQFFGGREQQARADWTRISRSQSWPSFGVLAAESELRRHP